MIELMSNNEGESAAMLTNKHLITRTPRHKLCTFTFSIDLYDVCILIRKREERRGFLCVTIDPHVWPSESH